MATFISNQHIDGKINLSEFIETLEVNGYDFDSYDDLIDASAHLFKLCNNKTFLVDYLNSELKDLLSFSFKNVYGPQSFVIHSNERFFLRANVWKPISKVEKILPNFRYDAVHDHNFDIVTVGYIGSGYQSHFYHCANRVVGYLGEKVDIKLKETLTLKEGTTLLIKAKDDIHEQLPPEEFSISINLIPRNLRSSGPQLEFDVDRKIVCRYLHSQNIDTLLILAGIIGNENTIEHLQAIAQSTDSPIQRALCSSAILNLDPSYDVDYMLDNDNNCKIYFESLALEKEDFGKLYKRL